MGPFIQWWSIFLTCGNITLLKPQLWPLLATFPPLSIVPPGFLHFTAAKPALTPVPSVPSSAVTLALVAAREEAARREAAAGTGATGAGLRSQGGLAWQIERKTDYCLMKMNYLRNKNFFLDSTFIAISSCLHMKSVFCLNHIVGTRLSFLLPCFHFGYPSGSGYPPFIGNVVEQRLFCNSIIPHMEETESYWHTTYIRQIWLL